MLIKTQAIVLHHFPYSDSGKIVNLYTKSDGRISVLARGKGKSATLKTPLLQPFTLLDITLDSKPNRNIQYVKESAPLAIFTSIPFNPVKSAITLFLAEILYKTLREQHSDEKLFNFLNYSIQFFDKCENGTGNFHLIFLFEFSRYLGFFPNITNYNQGAFFDLQNGILCQDCPPHNFFLSKDETKAFINLMRFNYQTMHLLKLSRLQRQTILEQITLFFRIHLPEIGTIKSLDILKQIFE
ncbi:MAG: DNA repair protein RecO [Prevotellaceae bacterium]|jgi:DNA repair protein RecO (recombination protein O)|nr:DNA repair protein RecO [Prevotellaceae bacterium]